MTRTVSELMTPHPTVVEVSDTLRAVAQTMATQDLGSLVVARDGVVVGIVTDRDLVVRGLAEGVPLDAAVGDLATDDLLTVGPDDDVADVVRIMREQAVRRVPVVRDGEAVGVLTIGDLAAELDPGSALAEISEAPAQD